MILVYAAVPTDPACVSPVPRRSDMVPTLVEEAVSTALASSSSASSSSMEEGLGFFGEIMRLAEEGGGGTADVGSSPN